MKLNKTNCVCVKDTITDEIDTQEDLQRNEGQTPRSILHLI